MPREQLDPLELEPAEVVLCVAHASFRGAAAVSMRATLAFGAGRMRDQAYNVWRRAAIEAGFPPVPNDMILAVSDRRLLFGKPNFWGRAGKFTAELDFDRVAQVVAVRHGLVTGVAFALRGGAVVEVEAMRGRQLRRAVAELEERLPRV